MRQLLRLAAAENETWGNNATGEFNQRFRTQLPGTSVDLKQRVESLSELLDLAEEPEIPVLIFAMSTAIKSRNGSRTIGSERHGSRVTYTEYRPKVWGEIFDYVRDVLKLMAKVASRNTKSEMLVRDALGTIDGDFVLAAPIFDVFEFASDAIKAARRYVGRHVGNPRMEPSPQTK